MGYLFLFLISFSVYAHENCEQHSPVVGQEMNQVMDAVALTWWSVSYSQYDNAVCKSNDVPDWDAYFATQPDDRDVDREINGFQFKDESKPLLDAFRDIYPSSAPVVSSGCENVLCAVDEIWGRPLGRKILYIRLRHGYNTSEFTRPNARRFNDMEINEILETFGDLPPEMQNLGRGGNQPMVLAGAGETHPGNREAAADAGITFYDRWRVDNTTFNRQYGLYHEFAHNMGYQNGGDISTTPAWQEMARTCRISEYGNTNSIEDFAETVVMYRFNGPGLKERCPAKFEYLKANVFRGREYLTEADCSRPVNQ